mgnify:FL=1
MIGILDYGVGNVAAFFTIYERLNINAVIISSPDEMQNVKKLILPGVGSFDESMLKLEQSGMKILLDKIVLKEKIPLMGVCVGMQMLANKSEEGEKKGLGYIDGCVVNLKNKIDSSKCIPHMGWNNILANENETIWNNIDLDLGFYFLHSFYFETSNPHNSIASVEYDKEITCAVKKENIYGFQFHPEKSQINGIQLLKNFSIL